MRLEEIQKRFAQAIAGRDSDFKSVLCDGLAPELSVSIYRGNSQRALEVVLLNQFKRSIVHIGALLIVNITRYIDEIHLACGDLNSLGREFYEWLYENKKVGAMELDLIKAELYMHDAYYAIDEPASNIARYEGLDTGLLINASLLKPQCVFLLESTWHLPDLLDSTLGRVSVANYPNYFVIYRSLCNDGQPVKIEALTREQCKVLRECRQPKSIMTLIEGGADESMLSTVPRLISDGMLIIVQES